MRKWLVLLIIPIVLMSMEYIGNASTVGSAYQSISGYGLKGLGYYVLYQKANNGMYCLMLSSEDNITIWRGGPTGTGLDTYGFKYNGISYKSAVTLYYSDKENGWYVPQISDSDMDCRIYSNQAYTQNNIDNNVIIILSNAKILYDDGSIYYEPPKPSDYYITDNADFYSQGGIDTFIEIEKKWEKNLNMQFFIKTYNGTILNEVQELAALGNSKSPTGNGSITIFINKQSDTVYRLGLGISLRAGYSLPYNDLSHNTVFTKLKQELCFSIGSLRSVIAMESFLEFIYKDIIYRSVDTSLKDNKDLAWATANLNYYYACKARRSLSDDSVVDYNLLSSSLTDYQMSSSVYDLIYEDPVDKYYWTNQYFNKSLIVNEWQQNDKYHIWFSKIEGTTGGAIILPPEEPGGEELPPSPPPGEGTEPTTPGGINPGGIDSGGAEIGGINIEPLKIEKKLPLAPLQGTLNRVNELVDSTTPPAIMLNLHNLLDAGTKRFDSSIADHWEDKDTIVVDFSYFDTLKVPGTEQKLIVWFKLLISAALYIFTAIALFHRFTPKEPIG